MQRAALAPRVRERKDRMTTERVVPVRGGRLRARQVSCQWRDGAGELHVAELTAAQSWPFLHRSDGE